MQPCPRSTRKAHVINEARDSQRLSLKFHPFIIRDFMTAILSYDISNAPLKMSFINCYDVIILRQAASVTSASRILNAAQHVPYVSTQCPLELVSVMCTGFPRHKLAVRQRLPCRGQHFLSSHSSSPYY